MTLKLEIYYIFDKQSVCAESVEIVAQQLYNYVFNCVLLDNFEHCWPNFIYSIYFSLNGSFLANR